MCDIFVSFSDKYITSKRRMLMKQKKPQTPKSLRWYHTGIILASALVMLVFLFMDNPGEMLLYLSIGVTFCFVGEFEKADELVKQNISKANTITMWILFAALCVFAMYARFHTLSASFIVVVIFSVLAIRSILFLIFDCSFIGKEKTDG